MPPTGFPQEARIDPFTGAQTALYYNQEPGIVPTTAPYDVLLTEIPQLQTPSNVVISTRTAPTNVAPTDNTYVWEFLPTTNYNGNAQFIVGRDSLSGPSASMRARALLQFAAAAGVDKALLFLYLESGSTAPVIAVCAVTSAWVAGTVDWNTQPSFDGVPYSQIQIPLSFTGYLAIDITGLYNKWASSTIPNYGLMLKTNEVDAGTLQYFTSASGTSGQLPHLALFATGNTYVEIANTLAPALGQVIVSYEDARVRFHSSAAGASIASSYFGVGSPARASDFWADPPTSSTSAGKPGQRAHDATYLYECIAANTWVRTAYTATF